jgi:hypothetical protein
MPEQRNPRLYRREKLKTGIWVEALSEEGEALVLKLWG